MKFTCKREELDLQLQYVSRVVTIRSSLPVLSNLLLETDGEFLRISATDLELAIATKVRATIDQEGSFTVPAKLFQDFIHQNPDEEVVFHLQSNELVCKSAQVEASIPGIDAEEYPALPSVEEKARVNVPAQEFIEALRKVVIACAQDQGRPVLTGVSCILDGDGITLAATDSFRLVEKRLPGVVIADTVTMLIPYRTIQELIRIATQMGAETELEMSLSEQQVVIRLGGVEVYSRLLTGAFPKYHNIIPHEFMAVLKVAAAEFTQALRLTAIFSQAGISNVALDVLEDGTLQISSYGSQRGAAKHTLTAKTEAGFKPLRAALNARFLLDAVGATGEETIELKFSGPTSPLVIATKEPDYLQLVMPIRLS
jgi:DNA polymerase-3 subunit beta